jgi:phosphonate transport system substrate-binding protein
MLSPVAPRIRLGVALSDLGRRTKRRSESMEGPTRADLDAFCEELSAATGTTIVAYAAPRYDRLLHRLKAGEIDLAWLSPVVALTALRSEVVPLALPERGESAWYWSALFVREDSPLHSVSNLHRARAVWVDQESASGFLVMRAALSAEGFDVDSGFASQSFARSHDAVVRAVLEEPSAVGATYLHLDASGAVASAGWGSARVQVLKRAGPIPSDVLAASSTLDRATADAVRTSLCEGAAPALAEAGTRLFHARRFVPADGAQLAHLRALERYLIRTTSFASR